MKLVTALVTGVGAPVGVSIIKALRASHLKVRVVGVDFEPLAQGLFRLDRAHLVPSARKDANAYFEALVKVRRAESAQILFSGWEGELPLLADRKAEFEERTGAVLPLAPAATRTALDKWLTVKTLSVAGVPVPDTMLPTDLEQLEAFRRKHAYPYVVKPWHSSGGRGLVLVNTDEELAFFSRYTPEPVVQEQLFCVGGRPTAAHRTGRHLPAVLGGNLFAHCSQDGSSAGPLPLSGPNRGRVLALELFRKSVSMMDSKFGRYSRLVKSIWDRLVAAIAMLFFSPLLLMIAITIYIRMGRPVLFSQPRPGKDGCIFIFYKFRTMTNDRDADGNLLPDEQRLTALGRFLRKTSLDELPQFWNVLKGDMSFVGPRPLAVVYLNRYTPEQARRHEIKPGITGWAQINGRNDITWEQKFNLDVWYVDHWSLWLDLKILLLTVWKVLQREGISQAGHATMEEFKGKCNECSSN